MDLAALLSLTPSLRTFRILGYHSLYSQIPKSLSPPNLRLITAFIPVRDFANEFTLAWFLGSSITSIKCLFVHWEGAGGMEDCTDLCNFLLQTGSRLRVLGLHDLALSDIPIIRSTFVAFIMLEELTLESYPKYIFGYPGEDICSLLNYLPSSLRRLHIAAVGVSKWVFNRQTYLDGLCFCLSTILFKLNSPNNLPNLKTLIIELRNIDRGVYRSGAATDFVAACSDNGIDIRMHLPTVHLIGEAGNVVIRNKIE